MARHAGNGRRQELVARLFTFRRVFAVGLCVIGQSCRQRAQMELSQSLAGEVLAPRLQPWAWLGLFTRHSEQVEQALIAIRVTGLFEQITSRPPHLGMSGRAPWSFYARIPPRLPSYETTNHSELGQFLDQKFARIFTVLELSDSRNHMVGRRQLLGDDCLTTEEIGQIAQTCWRSDYRPLRFFHGTGSTPERCRQ